MFIVPITRMEPIKTLSEVTKASIQQNEKVESGKSFQDIFKDAIANAENEVQATDKMDMMLANGQLDDLHTALIQAEQSAAAVEFTTQLTGKAVNAYNQIMGMQV